MWAQNASALGLSKLPASPPAVHLGVLAVVTQGQLAVLDAGSGFLRYMQPSGELTAAPGWLRWAAAAAAGGR